MTVQAPRGGPIDWFERALGSSTARVFGALACILLLGQPLSARAGVTTTLTTPVYQTIDGHGDTPADDENNLVDFSTVTGKDFTTTLYIRGNNSGTASTRNNHRVRAYVKFDLSALAAGGLTNATLNFSGYSLNANAVNILVSRLLADWPPLNGYNPSRSGSVNGGSIIVSPAGTAGDFSIDVTTIATNWVNAGAANYGFMLEVSSESVFNGQGIKTSGAGEIELVLEQNRALWFTNATIEAGSIETNRAEAAASLNGQAGPTDAQVRLYWSTNVANVVGDGTNATYAGGVGLGALADVALTNLTPDTQYYFAFYGSNTTYGLTAWSATNTFPTRIAASPVLLSAATNAANPYTAIDLQWLDGFSTESNFYVSVSNTAAGVVTNVVVPGVSGTGSMVTYTVSNLTSGIAYDFRVLATNSTAGAGPWSVALNATPVLLPEYTDALYRMQICFDEYAGAETLTNFPVLVVLKAGENNFNLVDLDSQGRDLRFTLDAAATQPLNYEMEGTLGATNHIWVQVPGFTNNTCIYAFWGSKVTQHAASQTNGAVWSNAYEGVWHLNAGADDSTANNRDGAPTGTTDAGGTVAGAKSFNGSSDLITITGYKGIIGSNPRTISAWIHTGTTASGTAGRGIVGWGNQSADGRKWDFHINQSGGTVNALRMSIQTGSRVATTPVVDSTWRMVAVASDGGNVNAAQFYVNGLNDGQSAVASRAINTASGIDVLLGDGFNVDRFGGLMDEVRISSVVRSAAWLQAEYATVASPTFATHATPDALAPPGLFFTDVTTDTDSIDTDSAEVSATLNGYSGPSDANVWLYWSANPADVVGDGTNDAYASGIAVGALPALSLTGLMPDTVYYYAFYGSNTAYDAFAWSDTNSFPTRIAAAPVPAAAVHAGSPYTAADLSWPDSFNTESTFLVSVSNAVEGLITNVVIGGIGGTGSTPGLTFSNLTSGLEYTFRVAASNTLVGSGPWGMTTFTPPLLPVFADATHRMAVAFTNYPHADTLTNFPVLVVLKHGEHGFNVNDLDPLGRDIRVTWDAAATVPLNYELEGALAATNALWVQVPAFTNHTTIYVYWGSKVTAHAESQTNGAVWSQDYEAVWHLNGNYSNATAHANRHGAGANLPSAAGGIAGGGQLFDGLNDAIQITGYKGITGSNARSISLWMRTGATSSGTAGRGLVGWGNASSNGNKWDFHLNNGSPGTMDAIRMSVQGGYRVMSSNAVDNTWRMVAVTLASGGNVSAASMYVNGVLDAQSAVSSRAINTASSLDVHIGNGVAVDPYSGLMDEVRISSVARSAPWLWAEYATVASSGFATYTDADEFGDARLLWEDVETDDASISTSSAQVSATLRGIAGPTDANVWLYASTNPGSVLNGITNATHASGVSTGRLANLVLTGLQPDTFVYYAFYATNTPYGVTAWSTTNRFPTPIVAAPSSLSVVTNAFSPTTAVDVRWTDIFNTESNFLVSVSNAAAGLLGTYTVAGVEGTGSLVSHTVSGLTPGVTYTFRVLATNSITGSGPWATQTGAPALPPAFADAAYNMPICFDGYDKPETLTNFPALVVLKHGENGFDTNVCDGLGRDLRFALDPDGIQPLNYEMEGTLAATNHIWVQVPALSSNACIYAFWGSLVTAHAECQTNGAVWSEGYEGVWHMNASAADSTVYKRHGALTGTSNVDGGLVAGARSFAGGSSSDRMTITGYKGVLGTNPRTISVWINTSNAGGAASSNGRGLVGWGVDDAGERWEMVVNKQSTLDSLNFTVDAPRVNVHSGQRVGSTVVTDSQWRHVTSTWFNDGSPNTSDIRIYVDGEQDVGEGQSQSINTPSGIDMRIGDGVKVSEVLNYGGLIDEVRVSSVARSSNWVWACHQTVVSTTFAAYAPAESLAEPLLPCTVFQFR